MTGQHAPDPREDVAEIERLRAEVEHWKAHAEEAGRGFAQVCKDAARISARNVRLVDELNAATAQDTADPADGLSEDPRDEEHLWLRDLRRHPNGEVRLYVGSRLVSGTHAASIPESIDRMLRLAARQRPTRQADTDRAVVEAVEAMAVCDKAHGADHNEASVYGHHASRRCCIRLHGTDTWVYDPRWENP